MQNGRDGRPFCKNMGLRAVAGEGNELTNLLASEGVGHIAAKDEDLVVMENRLLAFKVHNFFYHINNLQFSNFKNLGEDILTFNSPWITHSRGYDNSINCLSSVKQYISIVENPPS